MAFDDKTRRRLLKTVTECRKLLTGDFDEQLRGRFGIYADEARILDIGKLRSLDDPERQTARVLRERIGHLAAGRDGDAVRDAIRRVLREQAFTVLNRFAALRMAEERGMISESVRGGLQSKGFRIFEQAGAGMPGTQYERYLVYLDCLFDELSLDLGVLFDRFDTMGLLFPSENALRRLFDELNDPEISPLWAEDETIGWIYQYYNDPDERKKMRKDSATPRDSRELAVRNQFFTPRYVVEFLVDNTLGRIWYEMTGGRTRLADRCRYLVRRPFEFFLGGPDTMYWHKAAGTSEFHAFALDADPRRLPENPALGVLLGWVFSLKPDGFERDLSLLGLSRQEVVDTLFVPLENGRVPKELAGVHPVALLQVLWRLKAAENTHGAGDYSGAASENPIAGPVWETLRSRLLDPPKQQSVADSLKWPVFVPHRPLKDPREIRLLDPACGSMHFGLYAFDLFEVIYEEAWDLGSVPKTDFGADTPPFPHESVRRNEKLSEVASNDTHGMINAATARVVMLVKPDSGDGLFHAGPYLAPPGRNYRTGVLREMPLTAFDYRRALADGWMTPDEGERLIRETDAFLHDRCDPLSDDEAGQSYRRQIPRLIVENNIHGADIDPRAVQIATLSLWLRAQKSWQTGGLRHTARPTIRRSNIVCAEPMPGSAEELEEFTATLDHPLLGDLVRSIFEKMKLAGDAGTLLKIDEAIARAVENASKASGARPDELPGISSAEDLRFFEQAEERIYSFLREFAESTESRGFLHRLFAEDAARGFAFIDLSRRRYDAVVMNPPFGEWSARFKPESKKAYPNSYNDILGAFVERGGELLHPGGRLGAITSRTCFFLSSFTRWRDRVVLGMLRPELLVDLGHGVMDAAMVEAAAYVLAKPSAPADSENPAAAPA